MLRTLKFIAHFHVIRKVCHSHCGHEPLQSTEPFCLFCTLTHEVEFMLIKIYHLASRG